MSIAAYVRANAVTQDFDVRGSTYLNDNRILTDETAGLGLPVVLASGSSATISAFSSPSLTLTGLSGQSAASVGSTIVLSYAGLTGNNGAFTVTSYVSATSVVVSDASGFFPDPNSGSIEWAQYNAGVAASITTVTSGVATITGLLNMTQNSVGHFLTISGAATSANNGTFLIVSYISATSVTVSNGAAVASDGNNGAIGWTERNAYVLNDDLDFERTDRSDIKGVKYDQPVPSYYRPDLALRSIPKNLTNIVPLDSKLLNVNRIFYSASVASTNTSITITSAGNLKHASTSDLTGVPCFDVAPYVGDYTSCYVGINNTSNDSEVYVLAGPHAGEKVFGVTENGASTSPNTVEVHFYSVPVGGNATTQSTAYTWEAGQPTTINLVYGYGERGDLLDLNCLRSTPALGVVSDAAIQNQINNIYSYDGTASGDTNISAYLTNTGNYFPFSYLAGGASDTVIAALNVLNSEFGNMTFTGSILTSGSTITQALQSLSNAVTGTTVVRYIERLASSVSANTSHLLPGGATYTLDGTNNGKYLFVFWRGLLRDPGTVANGDDYAETDTTHITPYSKLNAHDHVTYITV
jgi:hypothetical protein